MCERERGQCSFCTFLRFSAAALSIRRVQCHFCTRAQRLMISSSSYSNQKIEESLAQTHSTFVLCTFMSPCAWRCRWRSMFSAMKRLERQGRAWWHLGCNMIKVPAKKKKRARERLRKKKGTAVKYLRHLPKKGQLLRQSQF